VTLPLVVIIALLIGNSGGSKHSPASTAPAALPALTPSAPPSDAATVAPCIKVLETLPVQLGDLLPRRVHPKPDSVFVVAWGDPAVVLRCGVARPADLKPAAELKPGTNPDFVLIGGSTGASGAYFDVTEGGGANVFTTVDRAAYISITVPTKYASGPVPALAQAIAKALPPVCIGAQEPGLADQSKLCVYRK
jgi:hypothetical protein